MTERFNAVGISGRDCPICMRVGTLAGERVDGGKLECGGCAAKFTLRQRVDLPDELERAPGHVPIAMPRVCGCGRKHWGADADCGFCVQAASIWPSGIPGR